MTLPTAPSDAPSPKPTPPWMVLAAAAGVLALNFAILAYSTRVAVRLPVLPAPPGTPAGAPLASADAAGPAPSLLVKYTAGPVPGEPAASAWMEAPEMAVLLGPQDVAIPMGGGSVTAVSLRALHDGSTIAFRLEWADDTEDLLHSVDKNRDGVALQFPMDGLAPPPSALMGEAGKPVNIWQWRADWQEAAAGPSPHPAGPDGTWYPPQGAIMTDSYPQRPPSAGAVAEYIAEGWSTLTKRQRQTVTSSATWEDGIWSVVFQRPLGAAQPGDAVLVESEPSVFNVAVWNGGEGDVNGFKSVSKEWTPLRLEPRPDPGSLIARHITGELSADPADEFWTSLPAQAIALSPQRFALPFGGGSTTELRFRAAHNGRQIAFHLEWRDDTVDWENGVDTYKDAVALQFPLSNAMPLASPLMGERDKPVAILQWRADWQADATDSFDRMARQPSTGSMQVATVSLAGLMPIREQPDWTCMEYIAAGWGTLTRQQRQNTTATAVHEDGTWKVVLLRDLSTPDPSDPAFAPGQETFVNFAVWNGSAREVNGMKSIRMTWTPLMVEAVKK